MTPAQKLADGRTRFSALRDRCAVELAEAVRCRTGLAPEAVVAARQGHDSRLEEPGEGESPLSPNDAAESFELAIVLDLAEHIRLAIDVAVEEVITASAPAPAKKSKAKSAPTDAPPAPVEPPAPVVEEPAAKG